MSGTREERLQVRCLGDFMLLQNGLPVTRWKAGRARTLFEYLLVNRNSIMSKDRLEEVLWPEAGHAPGPTTLRVIVHEVRRTLKSLASADNPEWEVEYRDYGYLLQVSEAVWIDYEQFQRLIDSARLMASEGQQAAAAGLYEQALDLYRGDFLAGSSEHWLLDQREWLRSMAMRAITQLTRQALAREQLDAVLNYSRRALDIDHYNEGVYRTLMFVHARRGETAQVERWHQLCTSRLRQHFDVSPSPATQRLLHAALRGEFVDEGLLALA